MPCHAATFVLVSSSQSQYLSVSWCFAGQLSDTDATLEEPLSSGGVCCVLWSALPHSLHSVLGRHLQHSATISQWMALCPAAVSAGHPNRWSAEVHWSPFHKHSNRQSSHCGQKDTVTALRTVRHSVLSVLFLPFWRDSVHWMTRTQPVQAQASRKCLWLQMLAVIVNINTLFLWTAFDLNTCKSDDAQYLCVTKSTVYLSIRVMATQFKICNRTMAPTEVTKYVV